MVSNMTKDVQTELTEDMEVIGPGQMLREARENLKLTQKDVAEKLKFTLTIVKNIENDQFDHKLPSTYTRGYLKNFARLVHVNEEDVLDSYDLLGVAAVQQAEMQSFSKITSKQAENNRLMWFSYLVLALLIGSTVVWWMQEHRQIKQTKIKIINHKQIDSKQKEKSPNLASPNKDLMQNSQHSDINDVSKENNSLETAITTNTSVAETKKNPSTVQTKDVNQTINNADQSQQIPILSNVTFSFSGDCWVNIYDATGERIAWGIKKADYVMHISGQAPFNITLGKPELVSIDFKGKPIDMSQFNSGNIAKFTLPLNPNP